MGYRRKLVTRHRKENKQRPVYDSSGQFTGDYETYLAEVPYTTYENVWDSSSGGSYDSGSSSSGDSGSSGGGGGGE